MAVSSVSTGVNPSALLGLYQQRKNDFKTMASDVQSGNMGGAQSALAALQQAAAGIQGTGWSSSTGGSGSQQASPLQTAFANLIGGIQSGSLSGAQSAPGALQPAQSVGGANAASKLNSSSFSQDLASLIQSVQSGNLGTAQQDLGQLQSDLKSQGAGHHHRHRGEDSSATASNGATGSSSAGSTGTAASASAYATMMNLQASSPAMNALA